MKWRKVPMLMSVLLTALMVQSMSGAAQSTELDDFPTAVPSTMDQIRAVTQEAVVSGHVDGDKFKVTVDGKEREVNLIGADAPELGECMFDVSTKFLSNLLPVGTTVYLEKDKKDKDKKDRLLRYVWLEYPESGDADLINQRVVRYGYAGWISKDGNTARDAQISASEARAKEASDGIWFECGSAHAEKPLLTCMMVPKATMDAIRAGFEESFEPRVWKAVIARPHPDYPYIVAAIGPVSIMSDAADPDVAVWAVNDLDNPTRIISADIMAGTFSNFPDGSSMEPPVNDSTLGVAEAIACTGSVADDGE